MTITRDAAAFLTRILAEDGDSFDVLIALDFPTAMGAVKTRLIGAIKAEQRKKGKKWKGNDQLIAVGAKSILEDRRLAPTAINHSIPE